MNNRFKWIEDWNKPQFFPERLEKLKIKKPKIIFMNSMSDIADWEDEWIVEVFKALMENPQHRYLFLSKRPDDVFVKLYRLWNDKIVNPEFLDKLNEIAMFGRTIESNTGIPYANHNGEDFLSIEPLLNEVKLNFKAHPFIPKWVIIGAETGNRKNKVIPKKEWIDNIVKQCKEVDIPVFMKDSLIPIVGEENMLREFPEGLRR